MPISIFLMLNIDVFFIKKAIKIPVGIYYGNSFNFKSSFANFKEWFLFNWVTLTRPFLGPNFFKQVYGLTQGDREGTSDTKNYFLLYLDRRKIRFLHCNVFHDTKSSRNSLFVDPTLLQILTDPAIFLI